MRYVFVREYNPAYDFYLFEYFRGGGMSVDGELTIERARRMRKTLEEKPSLKSEEKLFCDYVSVWNQHPESRPSLYYLFNKIPAHHGEPNASRLAELESDRPPREDRILFSAEDVAKDFTNFYKRQIGDALKHEIESDAPGSKLGRYLSSHEINSLPDSRVQGPQKAEEAIRRKSREVLGWANKVTSDLVLKDIEQVLGEHSGSQVHMRRTRRLGSSSRQEVDWCEHKSEYVRLAVYQDILQASTSMFLEPVRGYGSVQDYYEDVLFPRYYALELKEGTIHSIRRSSNPSGPAFFLCD